MTGDRHCGDPGPRTDPSWQPHTLLDTDLTGDRSRRVNHRRIDAA